MRYDRRMRYPDSSLAPPPNPDLPPDIIADSEEATSISSASAPVSTMPRSHPAHESFVNDHVSLVENPLSGAEEVR